MRKEFFLLVLLFMSNTCSLQDDEIQKLDKSGQTNFREIDPKEDEGKLIELEKVTVNGNEYISYNQELTDKSFYKVIIKKKQGNKEEQVTWGEILQLWNDNKFLDFYIKTLQTCKFNEYYFNAKPAGKESDLFEFVLNQTTFSQKTDGQEFKDHMDGNNNLDNFGKSVSFLSKSGNTLVIPSEPTKLKDKKYHHIASFTKYVPINDQYDVWKLVSKEIDKKLKSGSKIFLVTSGKDVPWLHIRIDKTNAYITYPKYK